MWADPRVGTELAGHRILSVIGRGGMAVVYLAEHLRLGRKVALKVLDPEIAEDEAFRDRFIRESRIAAGLDHPNVVTVYDAGESEGVLFISMRYVEGTDLERLLRTGTRLQPSRAVSIISQAASALDAAHAQGLVHRDVKPGNILLSAEPSSSPQASRDRVYLSDFGVTKRMHSGSGLTRTGQFVGTVDYVAPEQIRGEEVDGRADVYSLGCVLYRCLTGSVPFPRETEVGTIYAHLQDAPPPPTSLRPELGPAIDRVVSRALAKEPKERFTTCWELSQSAGRAVGDSGPATATAPRASTGVSSGTRPRARRGSRRRSRLVWGGIAAGVVVFVTATAAVTFVLVSGPAGQTPSSLPHLAWHQSPDIREVLGGPGNQEIASVVAVNGTLVAVGRDERGGDMNAAAWTSASGSRWERASSDELGGSGEQRMEGAVILGEEVVAVGEERSGGDTDPAVWISRDDGTDWRRVDAVTSRLHERGGQMMHDVVALPGRLVAVGHRVAGASLDAAVWDSSDGRSWDPLRTGYFGGPGHEEMFGAAALGQDTVAVGYGTTDSGDRDAAVWVGSGGTWTRIHSASLGGSGNQEMNAVVAGGPGLVAVGSDDSGGDTDAAVWTSTDGRNWTRVPHDEAAFGGPGNQSMATVVTLNSGLIAAGSSDSATSDSDGAVWLSSDGVAWTRQPPGSTAASPLGGIGQQRITSLVTQGRQVVAVGTEASAGDDNGAVWFAHVAKPSS